MNFFTKNRIVFWVLIFLVIINLTALITFLWFYSRNTSVSNQQVKEKPGMTFRKELSLTPSQSKKVDAILADYRNSTEPITTGIRNYRTQLLEELAKDKPDTTVLNRYADEICSLQKVMQLASIKQYMELKKICNPDQCQRLSSLYFELYGFQGKGPGMGKGKGKGMIHQYRRGQGQQGRGNMMGKDSCGR